MEMKEEVALRSNLTGGRNGRTRPITIYLTFPPKKCGYKNSNVINLHIRFKYTHDGAVYRLHVKYDISLKLLIL